MRILLLILFSASVWGQTIGVNRTTGETLDAGLKYNMATARFDLTNQTASGSSTNLAIDARYREHFITADASFQVTFTNAVGSDSKAEFINLTITNSSGGEINLTNLTSETSSTIYAGLNTVFYARIAGSWISWQDTAKTPADMIGDGSVSDTEFGYLDGVTSAIQTQLDEKAPVASPVFTGDPSAPTPTEDDDDSSLATTAFVQQAISGVVAGSGTAGAYAYASTSNNVAIPVWTNALASGTGAFLSADVTGRGPTNKFSFKVLADVDNPETTAILTGTNLISIPDSTNMVAYWTVEDDSAVLYLRGFDGENVNWLATNILAVVQTNGTETVSAEGFGAIEFDGVNDSMSAPSVDFGTTTITVAFWMKWDAWATADNFAFELSANFNNTDGAFFLGPNSSVNTFAVGIQDGTGASAAYRTESISSANRPTAATWHHYAIVYIGTTGGADVVGDIKVYIDGVLKSTAVGTSTKSQASVFPTDTLFFMARGGVDLFSAGSLSDFRIYNSELSAGDIITIYNSKESYDTTVTSGLIHHWKFNDGTADESADGLTVLDSGSSEDDATVSGGVQRKGITMP